jgi:DNA-binding GntR family transcriptional regulator
MALGKLLGRLARFMDLRHAGKSQSNSHARIIESLSVNDLQAARQALLDELEVTREAILDGVLQEETAFWHLDNNKTAPKQPKEAA